MRVTLPKHAAGLRPEDKLQASLHDLTNALASARSYVEVILLHAKNGTPVDAALAESLLQELDRAGEMVRTVRLGTYQPGDVLACARCGYTFVFRKASSTSAACRRCKTTAVERWKPTS